MAMGAKRRRSQCRRLGRYFHRVGHELPYRYGINSLLLNQHGDKFVDAEFVLGIEPRKSLYTPIEIDCSDPQERQRQEELQSKVLRRQGGKIHDHGAALQPVFCDLRSRQ